MYSYVDSGGAAKALFVFVGLLLAIALFAGLYLGGSEFFSPSVSAAKSDKLKAEAAALREKTEYERSKHEIELEALQKRQDRQLELMGPIAIIGIVFGSVAVTTLTAAVSYWVIEKGRVLRHGQTVPARCSPSQETQPVPSMKCQEKPSRGVHESDSIERENVSPFRITYDGLLAYFCQFFQSSNGAEPYYPEGITPEVAGLYLWALQEVRVIRQAIDGSPVWKLREQIKGPHDVKRRIPRESFDIMLQSYSMRNAAEQLHIWDTEHGWRWGRGSRDSQHDGQNSVESLAAWQHSGASGTLGTQRAEAHLEKEQARFGG